MTQVYKKDEIVWLSVLQGWAMLLVVIGHVRHGASTFVWETPLQNFIYSFHMPLFMFISGYLFYLTQMRKSKAYSEMIKNKAQRLLIPYFILSLVTLLLKVTFSQYMRRPANFSFDQILDAFVFLTNNPLGEMWFINALFGLFLLYPLYKIMDDKSWAEAMMLFVFIFLYFWRPTNLAFVLDFSSICRMGVFFYTGLLLAKYCSLEKLAHWGMFAVLSAFLLLVFFFKELNSVLGLLCAFAGIFASYSLALNLVKVAPSIFISFRNYTYQIFLLGIFPQIFVRIVFNKLALGDYVVILMYVVSIALGIYSSVLISKIVQKSDIAVIKHPLGLR